VVMVEEALAAEELAGVALVLVMWAAAVKEAAVLAEVATAEAGSEVAGSGEAWRVMEVGTAARAVAGSAVAMEDTTETMAASAEHRLALEAARLETAAAAAALAASAGRMAGRMATPCCTNPSPSTRRPMHSSP
jgi:diaminopimelate decarboxylase